MPPKSLPTSAIDPAVKEYRRNKLKNGIQYAFSQATDEHRQLVQRVFGPVPREYITTTMLHLTLTYAQRLEFGQDASCQNGPSIPEEDTNWYV